MVKRSLQWKIVLFIGIIAVCLVIPIGILLNVNIASFHYNQFRNGIEKGFNNYEPAAKEGIDDVAFVLRVIDRIAEIMPVDLSRVYVFGFSNGAMLTYSLAASHPDRVAAIAAISGTFGRVTSEGEFDWQLNPPASGMPVLVIHGSADPRLPYAGIAHPEDGRGGNGMIPVVDSARFWAGANGCNVERDVGSGFDNVALVKWSDCATDAPVNLYRLNNWGHRWSGSSPHTKTDYTTVGSFESIEVIWEFFRTRRTKG